LNIDLRKFAKRSGALHVALENLFREEDWKEKAAAGLA